jgi:D-alanyl-D-alanine-carboxypeptidase/D-alanyl-D-alanine-endopeptidase
VTPADEAKELSLGSEITSIASNNPLTASYVDSNGQAYAVSGYLDIMCNRIAEFTIYFSTPPDFTLHYHTWDDGLDAQVDQVVRHFLVAHDIPGAAVGVVRGGTLIYAKGHGVRSVERREPVMVNTLFQIGSVTKVFTTTLLVQLRDQGRLALVHMEDQYLPEHVETPWRAGDAFARPTLRQLATHRAGLPRNPPNRLDRPHSTWVMEPYSLAELYQGLAMTTLTFFPGTSWQYSNYGFAVLGHALERATGQPYEVLLHE